MDTSFSSIFSPEHILQILIVVVASYALQFFAGQFIGRLVKRTVRGHKFETKREEILREDTLTSIIHTSFSVVVWIIAAIVILAILGFNIAPVLAGAGVAGIALGFGAQTIVKDFLAGIFILSENQFRVGDVVMVNQDVAGTVESLTLRMTVLRDLEGRVHYVPNGSIEIATNLTMGHSNVELDILVGYDTDIDKLEKLINATGVAIFEDEAWKGIALEAPHMLRLDDFAENGMTIKIVCRTAPIRQWEVKSEILRRLKKAFDKEGIVIPLPQRVVHSKK